MDEKDAGSVSWSTKKQSFSARRCLIDVKRGKEGEVVGEESERRWGKGSSERLVFCMLAEHYDAVGPVKKVLVCHGYTAIHFLSFDHQMT